MVAATEPRPTLPTRYRRSPAAPPTNKRPSQTDAFGPHPTLSAAPRQSPPAAPTNNHPTDTAARRRRVIACGGSLAAVTVAVAAATSAAAAWAVAGVILGLLAAYGGLLAWADHRATLHQWDLRPPDTLEDLLGVEGVRVPDEPPAVTTQPTTSLARFLIADTAGWLLAPVVFAVDLILGRTPADSAGQRWLANLRHTQDRLRDRSVHALAVGAVTTAGVTAAGLTGTASAAPVKASAAPVTAAAPIKTNAGGGGTYTVRPGDTLGSIAAAHGTTWPALAALNHLANPNFITVGEILRLGGAAATASASVSGGGGTYTVRPGDTLGSIAAAHGTTWPALAALNHLANPNFITVGEVLRLGGDAPTAATVAAAPAAADPPVSASGSAAVAVHTALAQVGKPYQWGGAGPWSYDCSGLVMYAWAAAGVSLPHNSVLQYEDTIRISAGQLQPGDLIFYDTGGGAQPGHVSMYIGNGEMVTADTWGTPVRVEVTSWDGPIMGYGRVR